MTKLVQSELGYYYVPKEKRAKKVSPRRKTSPKRKRSPERKSDKPKVGDFVRVIIKPYEEGVTEEGIVKQVLTKKKEHTRGHKVKLESGTVGRLLEIITKA